MIPMTHDPVEAIAQAVLYEGYLLWPYRRSAFENRQRFTFGGVYPPGFCAATRQGDRSAIACECLVEADPGARLAVELRFLQRVYRQVLQRMGADERPVDELHAAGQLHLTWDEAAERRAALPAAPLDDLAETQCRRELHFPAGGEKVEIRDAAGDRVGTVHRTWESVTARLSVAAERLRRRLYRVRVEVVNRSVWEGPEREQAQKHSLLSTHLLLTAAGGSFVSAIDPPRRLAAAAAECRNEGVWPVLVGAPGARDRVLAAPIILEDHPQVAPESPGDLFDGGEIDLLPTLDVMALSDDEKEEMAATDPRARAILERTERMTPGDLMRLHGTSATPAT